MHGTLAAYPAVGSNGLVPPATCKLVLQNEPGNSLVTNSSSKSNVDIIDIRSDAIKLDLKHEIFSQLQPAAGPRKLPTLLLYDEKGLQLFEKITYLEEYYLTNAEIDVLKRWGGDLAANIQSETVVVELGSGNLRKVSILLEALDAAGKEIDYYALDLSLHELQRTLAAVPKFKHVTCHGLHGTYDDGLAWLKSNGVASRPKCILSLGSSIGNFSRTNAAIFLKDFADTLRPCDTIIVGLDACNDPARVYKAYNDKDGITHEFILNGLENANQVLDSPVFDTRDWSVIGEYVYDKDGGRHQAFYVPQRDVTCLTGNAGEAGVRIAQGERVQVEESLKYSADESAALWEAAGLREMGRWAVEGEAYYIHLLTKREMPFYLDPSHYAASTTPSLAEWRGIWAAWDTVTRGMIPNDELLNKPIKLRNACIFYLGHIPTFLDLQLHKATAEPLCQPDYYPQIFERGIDPDVDNPNHCHDHSEIPEEWPPLKEILGYQTKVRAKVESLYDNFQGGMPRKLGRSLWMALEHEIMHLETLLYMLLQSDRTLPPPRSIKPDFEGDAELAAKEAIPNKWFTIPEQHITLGLEDPEDNSGPDRHFGWDNEKPPHGVTVKSFQAKARPITNEEYARYLQETGSSKVPASWAEHQFEGLDSHKGPNGRTNGRAHDRSHANGYQNELTSDDDAQPVSSAYLDQIAVRTVYGLIPLRYALHWPAFASYDELSGCAAWMGGRIPTVEEARSIYSHVNGLKLKEAEQHLGMTVPAVNGHLLNDGVEETPPPHPSPKAVDGSLPSPPPLRDLFTNLEDANVGFTHWYPVAITGRGDRLAGQAELGGVWEWTSSPLARHEGFEPMPLYPGYTADFFDGKHNIVLGGSWATHPRIAGRKTFVNWYQRNYPFAWVGARLVRDL